MARVPLRPLLTEIRGCTVCAPSLPAGPRPVVQAASKARVVIIGQAPGRKVHETGIPWDDPSGDKASKRLTDTVANWRSFTPRLIPMPHPSPRNQRWLVRNPWFEDEVIPYMQRRLKRLGLR